MNVDDITGAGDDLNSWWTPDHMNAGGIPTALAFQRYRHLGNTSCNFLFFDGHAEPRKLGTVTVGDLSIYPY
jgi:prepilin-type processing-associated H-X9-DG protein